MEKEKFYKKKWFAILMLIFFSPLGIILIWANKHFDKRMNTILSAVFGVWFIFVLIAGQPTAEEKAAEQARLEQTEKEREEKKKQEEEMKQKEAEQKEKEEQEKKEQDEKRKAEFEQAVKDWDDHFKDEMLEHYGEAGILAIEENPGSDFDVVNVYVPNEFKLSSEEEKIYYVEEIGPLLEEDLTLHFKKEHPVHVYFKYEDGTTMASRKMFGGWKIKK